MVKISVFQNICCRGHLLRQAPEGYLTKCPVPAYTMHINVNMTEISAQIWRKGIGWLCECDFKRSVHCNWCWHCNVANSKHMQQNVFVFFFFGALEWLQKQVQKLLPNPGWRAWHDLKDGKRSFFSNSYCELHPIWGQTDFARGKKANIWHFSFLHEISYLLTSLWHDLISPFNFDTATQKLGKDRKKCKREKSDFGSIFNPTLKKLPCERIFLFFICYVTSCLTLLLVGIPRPSFQPAISFQTFCLEKICCALL